MSKGRERMSELMSATSGQATSGKVFHCAPEIVSLLVTCRYLAPGVSLSSAGEGTRVGMSLPQLAATLTAPTFCASLMALEAHAPEFV